MTTRSGIVSHQHSRKLKYNSAGARILDQSQEIARLRRAGPGGFARPFRLRHHHINEYRSVCNRRGVASKNFTDCRAMYYYFILPDYRGETAESHADAVAVGRFFRRVEDRMRMTAQALLSLKKPPLVSRANAEGRPRRPRRLKCSRRRLAINTTAMFGYTNTGGALFTLADSFFSPSCNGATARMVRGAKTDNEPSALRELIQALYPKSFLRCLDTCATTLFARRAANHELARSLASASKNISDRDHRRPERVMAACLRGHMRLHW